MGKRPAQLIHRIRNLMLKGLTGCTLNTTERVSSANALWWICTVVIVKGLIRPLQRDRLRKLRLTSVKSE